MMGLEAKHLIAGHWVGNTETFENMPISGVINHFPVGTTQNVDYATEAAAPAFECYAQTTTVKRAAFLRKIASQIENRGWEITKIGTRKTGLPAARFDGERGRTTGQLALFA